MKTFRVSCLLLSLSLGGACGTVPAPEYPHSDPEQALRLHRSMRERVRSIQGEARVDQRGEEGRIRGTVLMFVERPARVRIDAMTQFGPAAILTIDGEWFAYNDLREGRFLTGRTCPANVARLLSLPMTIEQATPLLLGGTALIDHVRSQIAWDADGGFYRVELFASDGRRQRVDLGIREDDWKAPPERQRLRLLRSEIFDASGRSVWRARYGDYRVLRMDELGIAMPFEVRVVHDATGTDTLIRFKEIRPGAEVPEGAFHQEPRAGTTQEVLSCD